MREDGLDQSRQLIEALGAFCHSVEGVTLAAMEAESREPTALVVDELRLQLLGMARLVSESAAVLTENFTDAAPEPSNVIPWRPRGSSSAALVSVQS